MHSSGSLSGATPLVFFARDFSVLARDAIACVEEELGGSIRVYEPERDSPGQGHVFQIVRSKIAEADRVVTFVNQNNINVAFELGYALGLRKKVTLVEKVERDPPPIHWKQGHFLQSYIATEIKDYGDLLGVVAAEDGYIPLTPVPPARQSNKLLLCPGYGEGKSIATQIRNKLPELMWMEKGAPRNLDDLAVLHAFSDVVWIVTPDGPVGDTRDGAENTANAIFAGYLAALGVTPKIFLQVGFYRDLSDLKDWVQPFTTSADILVALGVAGRGSFTAAAKPWKVAVHTGVPADPHLAVTFAEYFPAPEFFVAVADALSFAADGASTPLTRWTALISHCAAAGDLDRLISEVLERARSEDRLDGGQREHRLAAGLVGPGPDLPAHEILAKEWALRSRVATELERIRPVSFDLLWDAGALDENDPVMVFARYALLLTWERTPPVPSRLSEIEAWVRSVSGRHHAVLQKVMASGWLTPRGEWAEPHLGEAVAAYALVADCERDPASGLGLVRWTLDHLHQLGPARRQILGLVLRWWPPACEAAVAWQAETLRMDPRGLDPRRRRDVLLQLTRCDALAAQIGIAPWADPALAVPGTRPGCAPAAAASLSGGHAPSVAWALRSGQERYVPYVLESLGETRTGVYSALLSRVGSAEAQSALARALCRLARDATDEPVLPAGAWGDALRASVVRYGAEARRRLHIPAVAARWLEIVDLPYSDDDLRELAGLFRAFTGSALGARARDRLALEPRMRRAWTALGPGRRPFVLQLNDTQLCRPNLAALVREVLEPPPADPAERADAELLITRHQDRCAEQ